MNDINNLNNNVSFGAKIIFMDRGKCFSLRQKLKLKTIAKKIGNSTDRFYVGTRKYDNISIFDDQYHFQRKDVRVLSTITGFKNEFRNQHKEIQDIIEQETSTYFYDLPPKERWKKFNNKLFENFREYLESFNISNYKDENMGKVTRKILKQEVFNYSKLKRTYSKKSIWEKFKEFFSNDVEKTPRVKNTKPYSVYEDYDYLENPNERITYGEAVYKTFVEPIKDLLSDLFGPPPY